MKKLYYISTNGYDCIVSADEEANIVKIFEQTDFPAEWDYDVANRRELTEDGFFGTILNSVEDDSSWAELDVNADEIESVFANDNILAVREF